MITKDGRQGNLPPHFFCYGSMAYKEKKFFGDWRFDPADRVGYKKAWFTKSVQLWRAVLAGSRRGTAVTLFLWPLGEEIDYGPSLDAQGNGCLAG
ncbi:hypothetical protein MTBLM1_100002 [Rhodospirillaceae bacterium LM-1]|nr:hypothetical protein MTBLM1_100002 [Rhodospirillaceae bacterium LM-1]